MNKFEVKITSYDDSTWNYRIEIYRYGGLQDTLLLHSKKEMDLLVDAIEKERKERWESEADQSIKECEYKLQQHIPSHIDTAELERMGKRIQRLCQS